jgi:hypothetical protein
MKTLTYNIILGLLSLLSTSLFAGEIQPSLSVDKRITKTFPISSDGHLVVDNSYGHIKVMNWDKNEVQFDILITAQASSDEKAQKSLENIEIRFDHTPSTVSAETEIGRSHSWWGGNKNTKYKVEYTIHAPSSLNLDLEMAYGDILLENQTGKEVKIDLAYGDLKTDNITGYLSLDLSYGDAVVHQISDALLDISYGDFNCVEAGDLTIESSYTDFKIQKAGNIKINGDYDDYILGDVGSLSIEGDYDDVEVESTQGLSVRSDYTDVKAGHVNGPVTVRADYGSYIIDDLGPNCTGGSFKCDYLTVKLNSSTSYGVDVSSSYTSVNLSDRFTTTQKNKEDENLNIQAHKGSKNPVFTFEVEYCSLYFK